MKTPGIQKSQIYLTAAATIYIAVLLAWEHTHGGVVSHHILHRSDLPAISNWWGGLLLPVLTWFLVGRISKHDDPLKSKPALFKIMGSILYGSILSAAFLNGSEFIPSLMAPSLLVLALFLPIYRAEYVLGFILGMTYVFGAILPTVFAAVVSVLGFLIYRFIRPLPIWIYTMIVSKNTGD